MQFTQVQPPAPYLPGMMHGMQNQNHALISTARCSPKTEKKNLRFLQISYLFGFWGAHAIGEQASRTEDVSLLADVWEEGVLG